jgi:uncharacterized damage-inducible protein DinB
MNQTEEAIAMWEMYRKGTIDELANLPEDKWDFRPGEGARTIRELAVHIAASAAGFAEELLGDGQFVKLRDPAVRAQLEAPFAAKSSKAEILDSMAVSGADLVSRLREAASKLDRQTMQSFGGERSRASGIWFAAAHEMYHRGQLATYARALGLIPAMTQKTRK